MASVLSKIRSICARYSAGYPSRYQFVVRSGKNQNWTNDPLRIYRNAQHSNLHSLLARRRYHLLIYRCLLWWGQPIQIGCKHNLPFQKKRPVPEHCPDIGQEYAQRRDGNNPTGAAGAMATKAGNSICSASFSTSSPPTLCPITIGLSSISMTSRTSVR